MIKLKTILAILGGTAVVLLGLAALIGIAYMNRPPSVLEKLVIQQQQSELAVQVMTAGCAVAGANDPGFGPTLNQSRGMVCIQVLGQNLADVLAGHGDCKIDDKKCLFTLGFALTKMRALQEMPDSYEAVSQLQDEIDTMYQKLNSTKERQ